MDVIFKIIAIALLTVIATVVVKPVRNDFALIIALTGGIILLMLVLGYVGQVFSVMREIISLSGVSSSLYTLLLKIVGVGYLVEFTAGICSDTGNSSLGDKVLLGGKVIILVMALPIVTNILQIIVELLPT